MLKKCTFVALLFSAGNASAVDLVLDTAAIAKMGEVLSEAGKQLDELEKQVTSLSSLDELAKRSQNLANAIKLAQTAKGAYTSGRNTWDRLQGLKNQYGSLEAYTGRYKSIDGWMSHPCFSPNAHCGPAEMAAAKAAERESSENRRKANEATMKALDKQNTALQQEADKLDSLTRQANLAGESLPSAALAANGLAAQQVERLQRISEILIASEQAATTERQARMDEEAKHSAARGKWWRYDLKRETPRVW